MLNKNKPDPCTLCQRPEGPTSVHCRPLHVGAYFCSQAGRVDVAGSMMLPTPDPIALAVANHPTIADARDAMESAEAAYETAAATRDASLQAILERGYISGSMIFRGDELPDFAASIPPNLPPSNRAEANRLIAAARTAYEEIPVVALALGRTRVHYQETVRQIGDRLRTEAYERTTRRG